MKKCRFNDANFIAMYIDGALPEEAERAFAKHLPGCRECMEALLLAKKDIFTMSTTDFEPLPDRKPLRARFRLLRGVIELLENIEGGEGFVPVRLLPVRGGKTKSFSLRKGGVSVEVKADEEDTFAVVLEGIRGKKIHLEEGGRIVERIKSEEDRYSVSFLRRGDYILYVDGGVLVEFTVR